MRAVSWPNALAGQFSLVPQTERWQWRSALARHLLMQMGVPDEAQVQPMMLTIQCLVGQGITDRRVIEKQIIDMVRNAHAARR
jgi:hypothetical protein